MEDFSLQGKVRLGASLNGKPGALRDVADAGLLQISPTSSQESRKESRTGLRQTSATINTGIEVAFSLTLNHGSAENLALGMYGEILTHTADSITGEALPAGLVAGDEVQLDRPLVTNLVVTDSDAGPTTLTLDTHYEIVDADGGIIRILDPAALVQPFVADYDHGASEEVLMFTQLPPVRFLSMVGINTVDGSNDMVRASLYKLKFNPVGQLDLINGQFGEIALTGTALLDTTAQLDPALGGYGKLELLERSA